MSLVLFLSMACQPAATPLTEGTESPAASAPVVVAGSVPVHHLTERLSAGQPWSVELLPPADTDPGEWAPAPSDIMRAQKAALVVLNGADYEAWSATAALPATRLIDSSADVAPLRRAGRVHSHGPKGAHSHGTIDPHTWMDPIAFQTQAHTIHAALSTLPGADAPRLDAARKALDEELLALEADLRQVAPTAHALASNHPAFGHLARRLELSITDFDLDPGAPPPAETASAVERWAHASEAPLLLWEATPSEATLRSMPAGVQHLTLDPLEHPSEGATYDYIQQARRNVAALGALQTAQD